MNTARAVGLTRLAARPTSVRSTGNITATATPKYAQAALDARTSRSSCCGPTSTCGTADPISSNLYDASERDAVPEQAVRASLGCGNPAALAELKPGETVLDLGSGGGIDVLLSARRVAPQGKAYGLDMTDETRACTGEPAQGWR
jgi:arsenite methyltransferase